MLRITIPGEEFFSEVDNSFSTVNDVVLELEHSLISLSKWESKHQKPFLAFNEKTSEDVLDYVRCMILTPDFPPNIMYRFTEENIATVNAYIESKESATTFGKMPPQRGRGEIITSELIYYWMVAFSIPFECETWHLNRLFSLIRICNVKQQKPKRMSKSERAEMLDQRRALNEQRKAQLGTKG